MANSPFRLNTGKCLIIAEIGVNHCGSVDLAVKMIDAAKNCGADAVKFQTFKAEMLATRKTPKTQYQLRSTGSDGSHYEMLKALELSYDDQRSLKEYCDEINLEFMSTPYDLEGARFLDDIGVNIYKTSSADIVDSRLQSYIASTGKTSIVSTGMSTFSEIENVVSLYEKHRNNNICLLHCVSNYPCSSESLNLKVIPFLSSYFGKQVGFSDHSCGFIASVTAVAIGATIIEKHFTLDTSMEGPDHAASEPPEKFKEMVELIRTTEKILGSNRKTIQQEEFDMRRTSRKSLVLTRNLEKGAIITDCDIEFKRPGTGISPIELEGVLGRSIRRDLEKDTLIDWVDLE